MIRMYAEIIRIRFLMMLAYRVNYYSGILIYSLNIGAYYFLWTAIYGGQGSINGFTALQMATYIAISWMSRAFYFNNVDREIATEIRDGTVAIQFIRPYNYLMVKVFQSFGEGIFRLVLFSVPGMFLVSLIFPIQLPGFGWIWLKFALSLFLGFVINIQINILVGILAFFVLNNQGMLWAKRMIVDLLSGLTIPIAFFPIWAQWVLKALPFQAISYLPSVVIVKDLSGSAFWGAVGVQAMWCLLLLIPIQMIWNKARHTLVVQGG
ncbi:ABC-2 type transport system permease protein [Croceifilum oryzae]|uniref:ABC-2 type transport system permease protein n=1 Tax=Croceifilum oryzae TaxID=1553429 RepID=A0AAJ1WVD8_9BACL|nr:ABC-2 type transport system permease protein [Croceifilum oryzae]